MNRTQPTRAIVLFIYLIVLFVLNYLAFRQWLPETNYKGLWFYTGIASILLGNLLVTPFYTKPVDAISYSVFSLIAIFLVNDWINWNAIDKTIYIVAVSFQLFIVVISFINILTKDSQKPFGQKISKTCFILSETFGNQKVVFSVVILYALIVFHRSSTNEMFFITIAWVLIVVIEPDKHIINLYSRIQRIWHKITNLEHVGYISAYQMPNMILIKQPEDAYTNFGTIIMYKDSHASLKLGLTLNYVGRDEELLLRAIEVDAPNDILKSIKENTSFLSSNFVAYLDYFEENPEDKNRIQFLNKVDELIGIVDDQTNVERLKFEVFHDDEIETGSIVEAEVNGELVLYQVLDGYTHEDIVVQRNKYGYAKAQAMKIGIWDYTSNKFETNNWIPKINSPVFLKKSEGYKPEIDTIGHFPNTNFKIRIENVNELVTHNTAILGILGIGKSMLSIEIVERLIAEKIKVICVDLTDQYAKELACYYDVEWHNKSYENIRNAGLENKDNFDDQPKEGGSVKNLTSALEDDINDFLHNDDKHYLKIYNPTEFLASKQLFEPKSYKNGPGKDDWKRTAPLWDVTPVEITSIISETTLKLLQDQTSDSARACLVFEEAHSLAPEWTSVATEGDKAATNRTARAILQGRKYGLGCLLITQRTANVTKSILNQCNSIFAMRIFDDTGINFISNYIGNDYAEKLPSLRERQAVFYGKSSSCENPVLIRLNDRYKFLEAFREKYPPPEYKENDSQDLNSKNNSPREENDDLPF
ncbi:MAG: DUF87 domain-containing protein [Bacteroidales bacterium]|nr:DUF87 domain-containing protein [Bacteroidales bacterium]MCF8336694.1 DUF87 domain-containing protein [Bacteroidales bacterium]